LECLVQKLSKENEQLRLSMLQQKVSSFYQINEEKLMSLIEENEGLRLQVSELEAELREAHVERDFLLRFNRNLKKQCQ